MELENLSIEKLKKLNFQELEDLASKMKEFMIDSTALTGGHIGANLSSLEISIALHKVFNSPDDKFLFDADFIPVVPVKSSLLPPLRYLRYLVECTRTFLAGRVA